MAPISSRSAISCKTDNIQLAFQSKIPIRRLKPPNPRNFGENAETNLVTTTEKPKLLSMVACSSNGKTNILKPPIKKSPIIPNLEWTKSKGIASVNNRKSIEKSKNRKKTNFKQATLSQKYFEPKIVANKQANAMEEKNFKPSFGIENKNLTVPPLKKQSMTTVKENIKPSFGIGNRSSRASPLRKQAMTSKITCDVTTLKELDNEFIPGEVFRDQILDKQKSTPAQPSKEIPISKRFGRLTISSSSTKRSTNVNRITPWNLDESRRCTWAPRSHSKKTVDPFEEAMESIRKIAEKKRNTFTPNPKVKARLALFQSAKKSSSNTGVQDSSNYIACDTGKKSPENTQKPFGEFQKCEDKRLNIPSIKVSFHEFKKSPPVVKKSLAESFGQQMWSAEKKKMLNKKQDPYEEAMARIRELKAKTPTNRYLKSAEKSTHKLISSNTKGSISSFTNQGRQRLDPFEVAMEQIKQLPTKTPPRRPRLTPLRLTPSTPIQKSIKKSLFTPENCSSLNVVPTPGTCTPRRVKFDFSGSDQSPIYRPLKSLLEKSILKKKARLTDISEHSEPESARSSEVSNKDFQMSPMQSLNNPESPHTLVSPLSASKVKHVDECDNYNISNLLHKLKISDHSQNSAFKNHEDCYGPKLRKVDTLTPKPSYEESFSLPPNLSASLSQNNSPFLSITGFRKLDGCHKPLDNSLCTPKAIYPLQSPIYGSANYVTRQKQPEVTFIHSTPISTPLVRENVKNVSNDSSFVLGPVKQKLKFGLTENNRNTDEMPEWLREFLNQADIVAKGKKEELQEDEECIAIFKNRTHSMSYCRQILNPVAKILDSGDDQHFIPIPEIME